jgi:glycine/D-amino acid oxidase-like deaminating enzyme
MTDADGNSFDGRIWVRDADRERVNDMKTGDETQADVLERVLDFYENHDPDAPADTAPDTDALADAVADRAADRISRPSVEVDPDAVADALADAVAECVDPATIAKKTADEVETRLR